VTLRKLADRLRGSAPVVVLRSLWLASALATEFTVVAILGSPDPTDPVIRADQQKEGRKALRKAGSRGPGKTAAGTLSGTLAILHADQALPLAPGTTGAVVLEDLSVETPELVVAELARAMLLLRAGGVIVSADRARNPVTEASLARTFLALGITHITQDRPREGALLTSGQAPHPAVLAALLPAAG
jgi:hypothetical protein